MNQQRPEPHPGAEVHSITAAPAPHSVDQDVRVRRYLISMSIRTVCVIGAVLVEGPLRWVCIAGAVVLPYVAVVMANAVGSGGGRPAAGPRPVHRIALPREADLRDAATADGRPDGRPDGRGQGRRSAEWSNMGTPPQKS